MFSPLAFMLLVTLRLTLAAVGQSAPHRTGPLPRESNQLVFAHESVLTDSGATQRHFEDTATLAAGPIARKEMCFRDVFPHPERYTILFENQTPILDAHGVVLLVADGIVHLANGTQAYKVDYCYPQNEPLSLYEYLGMCPLDGQTAPENKESKWHRGIRIVARGNELWPVFDGLSFLRGFILPEARASLVPYEDDLEAEPAGKGE
ncbi:hypothetical protein JCM3774_003308 [Rhodotorula dairenensis]